MLLTGRRKIEILRTGTLSAVAADAATRENAPAEHTCVLRSLRIRSASFCSTAGPWIAAQALNGRYAIRVANDNNDLRVLSRRPRVAGEAVRVALQIREARGAQWLAGETPDRRDVVAVGPDRVRPLAGPMRRFGGPSIDNDGQGWLNVGLASSRGRSVFRWLRARPG